jgi:glutathione peroxidase
MSKLPYQAPVRDIHGRDGSLESYQGKVLLVVNTASECGFTTQYSGLEAIYQRYRGDGLVILGFPCGQFGNQEPGDEDQIHAFCTQAYQVSFPMFAKVEVNGEGTHPVYHALKMAAPGLFGSKKIKWNFTKFLVGRDGTIVRRFAPVTRPEALAGHIEQLLEARQ